MAISTRRLSFALAVGTSISLVLLLAANWITGATQEAHEWVKPPARYAADLLAEAQGVRIVFAFDTLFIAVYVAFFAVFTAYLRALGRSWASVALGAILVAAALDVVENQHILALLGGAEHGELPSESAIAIQQVVSQVKFTAAFVGLATYGFAIPRTTLLANLLVAILTIGTALGSGALIYAVPPDWRPMLDAGRWIGFLVGFVVMSLWLRSAPEPENAPIAASP